MVAWVLAAISIAPAAACARRTSSRDLVLVGADEAQRLVERRGLWRKDHGAWVDPRTAAAFEVGHIPGALSLPFQEVSAGHERLKDYRVLVVYGEDFDDPLAEAMSKRLIELGHDDVRTLRGGLRMWLEAGHSIERGAPQRP
jgi:3-mercaptopyruvate sulfurtransferase SseA